ncbi:MAG: thioesterase family protein [Pseudomonadales bacterium]|nr:thioesterase family protein [Pseudomonadales bacterium]
MLTSLIETTTTVRPEWADNNDHMNLGYYVIAFDQATDNFYDSLEIGPEYRARENSSIFTLGINVDYIREVFAGDSLRITTQLLDCDEKKMRYIHYMYEGSDQNPVAMNECLAIHVEMSTRKSAPFPEAAQQRLNNCLKAHSQLAVPKHAGRVLGRKTG